MILRKEGNVYTADLVGKVIPVRAEKVVSFELPNTEGSFRGQWSGKSIRGHWYQPFHATAVRLEPDGPNRWRGEILPYGEIFRFFLMLQKRPDGTIGAYLRNPERAWGAEVHRLELEGNIVKLLAKRGKEENVEFARLMMSLSASYVPPPEVERSSSDGGQDDGRVFH